METRGVITPEFQFGVMRPPFIGTTDSGEEYLVEAQMSGLGRPGKMFARPLSQLSAIERLEPSEISHFRIRLRTRRARFSDLSSQIIF